MYVHTQLYILCFDCTIRFFDKLNIMSGIRAVNQFIICLVMVDGVL